MRNKAFTLVELIAATTLSTLLFISALSIIRSIGRAQVNDSTSRTWALAARQQLQWDVNNAVVFRQDDHGLVLGGYGSMDAKSYTPTHLPVIITYSLRNISSRLWLVREQSSLDPLLADTNFSEWVCGNVRVFAVTGSYAPRTESPGSRSTEENDPTPMVFQHLAGVQRMPDRFRIRISLADEAAPAIDTVLYLN